MADEHVWRFDLGSLEQPLEVVDFVARVVHTWNLGAAVEAGAVVAARARRLAEFWLHVAPVVRATAEAGLEHDRGAAAADALEVQVVPVDVDDAAGKAAHGARLRLLASTPGRECGGENDGERATRHDLSFLL